MTAVPVRFDPDRIRRDFPALSQSIHGKPLVYLDNAATTQKPAVVLDRIRRYYETDNANVHRGVHTLSQRATEQYEAARKSVQRHIGAADPREIIFVRSTTEGINLIAQTFGRQRVKSGDEILISTLEHHSNIVPWQMLCEQTGAHLRVIPITDSGELILEEYKSFIGPRTRLVSVVHVSNALGTVNPVGEIVDFAHSRGVPVVVDGAQAVPHLSVDVRALGCDFYVFSGHKTYAPTGIGALYGKAEHLQAMPPYQGGGDMILSVTFEKTTFNDIPYKFEAGTPHISGAIALETALRYISDLGLKNIEAYERELLNHATEEFKKIPGVRILGTAREKAAVISFVIDGIHPHDIGTVLDREGVAIRAGHHCTQPLMERLGVPATARASFAFYNTKADVDALVRAVKKTIEVFA